MGKAIPVIVGTHSFPTKTNAQKFFSSMLARYQAGDRVSEADATWLHELIELHPSADDKILGGIDYFTVQKNEWNNSFWLHRFDGSSTDWSYNECITPSSPERQAMAAFRTAIGDAIVAFRDSQGPSKLGSTCPLSGMPITSDNMEIAHERSFKELVSAFLADEGLALSQVAVSPSKDGTTKVQLADVPLRYRWRRFHQDNARLMVVTKNGNRHRPKGPQR